MLSACNRPSQPPQADTYDLEEKKEPTCQLDIRLPTPEHSKRFLDTLARFAAAHQIPVSPTRAWTPAGKELPRMYSTEDILIAPLLIDFPPVPPEGRHGQIRIHVLRHTFSRDRFIAFAKDFHATFRTEFGELVRSWEEPNDGER
jgi:hypothetical protein